MNYKLDGIPISQYGAYPTLAGQAISLHGIFDLPKRLGKTEHNWGTSIEPFVQVEDIQLDGRTLTLHVVLKPEYLETFKAACVACKALSIEYDSFNVVCKDEIKIRDIGQYLFAQVDFWQNEFILKPRSIIPSGSGLFRLDNFDLKRDFGISIAQSNNLLNTAKRIDIGTTVFYERTNYRGIREISLRCSLIGSSFGDVYDKMSQFEAVLMAPGLHSLVLKNKTFNVYFKDGITVNVVTHNILNFTIKAISV